MPKPETTKSWFGMDGRLPAAVQVFINMFGMGAVVWLIDPWWFKFFDWYLDWVKHV